MNFTFTPHLKNQLTALVLLLFCFNYQSLVAQSEVLIYQGPEVDIISGTCFSEGIVMEDLSSVNHNVTTIMNNLDATWTSNIAGKDVILIPEQERGNITFSPTVISEIQNFVNGGGAVIICCDYRNTFDELFGWPMNWTSSGVATSTQLSGNCIDATMSPSSIQPHSFTLAHFTSQLPAGAVSLYQSGSNSTVWEAPYGNGNVISLGWDWFNGGPTCGTYDADWVNLLEQSLLCGASGFLVCPPDTTVDCTSPTDTMTLGSAVGLINPDCLGELFFSQDGNPNGLYTLDYGTGMGMMRGMSGVTSSTVGLAPSADGDMVYGSTFTQLSHIQTDGSGAVIVGSIPGGAEALAYDKDGDVLYAGINGTFKSIDKNTGALIAVLAPPPGGADVEGLAYGGNGTIYGLAGFAGPRGNLYSYDIGTNTWTTIGYTGVDFNLPGLAYDFSSGLLYAIGSQDNNLYTIDPAVGTANIVGLTGVAGTTGGGLAIGGGLLTETFTYSGTIETWVVPPGVTEVSIEVNGASGGSPTSFGGMPGGDGARMSGTFSVTPGQVLEILVGQEGLVNPCDATGSGGGGTFVVDMASSTPLIVAGGGGGGTINHSGVDAVIGQNGTSDSGGFGTGGVAGGGGAPCRTDAWPNGAGGGGFSGNGATTSSGGNTTGGGMSFLNGGAGGIATPGTHANGGFGGGGSSHSCTVGGGGGGGYSGGAGGWHAFSDIGTLCGPVFLNTRYGGGGGGSFNSGTAQMNQAGVNTGNGLVTIEYQQGSQVVVTGFTDVTTPGDCPNEFTIERTFEGEDECGNVYTCVQTITVQDTTPPTAIAPPDTTINCEDTCHFPSFLGGSGAVAIIGADQDTWVQDVADKVEATGQFTTVDIINTRFTTPTVAELQQYDAVLFWYNFAPIDRFTLGDNLADYVDGGGVVVMSVFATGTTAIPSGRWSTDQYYALSRTFITSGAATLGTIYDPMSPLVAGVTSFNGGGASFRATGTLFPGATRVADWSDGRILVAHRGINDGFVVDLNIFPPSSDVYFSGWDSTTDGDILMANALSFMTSAAGEMPCTGTATATDNCEAEVTEFTYRDEFTEGDCPHEGTITRYWTATDSCGNESEEVIQIITIQDTTPPVVTAPADTTINCEQTCQFDMGAGAGTLGEVYAMRRQLRWPWGRTVQYRAEMDQTFGAGNWNEEFFETANAADIFNSGTSYVYMEGSDGGANELNTFLQANLPMIEDWVARGGLLFLNSAPNEGGNINFGFGGVTLIYQPAPTWNRNVVAVDPGHPVWNGPFLPTSTSMNGNFYGHAIVCPVPMTSIIQDDTRTEDVLVETSWGAGHVLFGGMTSWFFHNPDPQSEHAKYNMHAHLLAQLSGGPCTGFATAVDNCDEDPNISFRDEIIPGDCDGELTINRYWSAIDTCGNMSDEELQVIEVIDTIPPTALCQNVTVILDDWNKAEVLPEDIDNGSFDSCTDELTFSLDRTLFRCADLGDNDVVLTVTDDCGNASTCAAVVTVLDTTRPTLTCVPVTLQAGPGDCELLIEDVTILTDGYDNCTFPVDIREVPGGDYGSWDYWPLGTHEVWLVAEDESGNVSDTCRLQVTIEPFENPVTALFCNDYIQFSLDETCMTTLTADMILEGGPYTCYELYEVLVEDDRGNVQDLDDDPSNGTQLGWEHIGRCFKVTVRDQFNTNNRCWGTVCIQDKMRPMIEDCMAVTVDCGEDTDPLCFGGDIPCPVVFDNCDPILEASYVDWETLGSCEAGYDRIISRRWTFTDDWGNVNTCEQVITVGLGDLFSVAVPGDYDDVSNPALLCDEKFDENKDVSPHILDFPFCVDGYLLDSAVWFATGGDPTITNPDARDLSGDRLPMTLGWNCMDQGKYIGHPSPSTIYYDPHPQWEFFGVCWGPNEVVKWTGTGYPSPADCGNIQYTYRDTKIDLSDPDCNAGAVGCFKILRQWTVIDWCSGDVGGHDQIIKILDKEGPQIVMPDELEVGTDVWKCEGVVPIPAPWISDNCSEDVDYNLVIKTGQVTGNSQDGYTVVGLELGEHTLYIQAFDCCGNRSVDSITLNVVDNTPPVAVCEDRVQLSLTGNQSPGSNFSSICAEDLDQASYDNCTDWLWFKMIRMDELLGTVNGSFANNTMACGGVNGDDDAIISGNQVYFDDCSKFCCEDADQIVMVVLRVHDMDPGAGPVSPARYTSPAGDLVGRFTDCWVEIEVVDKAQPIVVAPPDMVVSCMFWFDDSEDALSDPSNATFGRVVTSLNAREKVKTIDVVCEQWCEDHPKYDYEPSRNTPVIWSQACDFYNSYYDAAHPDDKYELVWGFDGYAIRTCGAMPEIRVDDRRECGQGVILRDVIVSYQDPKTGGVVSFRDRQEIWVIDCDPFYVNTDDCFDDEDCIQWPLFCQQPDPLDGCGADLDPYTNPQLGAPVIENGCDDNCALVAVDYVDEIYTVEPDACFKVIRTWIIIDWCQYDPLAPKEYDGDNPNTVTAGRWEYVQSIAVRDKIDPVITTSIGDFCEPAEQDSNGVCYGHVVVCADATDDCSPDSWIVYDYKIDAFSDGVGQFGDFDFYVGKLTRRQDSLGQNLTQGPLDCEAYNQGGYCNPFADDPTQPFCASGTYPLGTHTIYWFAEDGCGNVTKDTTVFEVLDCKQPTPYCKTGIITVVMPVNGEICVWANDLDDGSFDNCTAQEDLKFYFNGDTSMTSYCVNCDTFAARGGGEKILFDVEVWVEDEEGNADFCITTIEVQDNMDVCEDSMTVTTITGQIENPLSGEMVEGVDVLLNGQIEDETASDGLFFFTTGLDLADVEVSGYHNERPLNGVSTADLVGIQRHLLGKKAFTSGYQMIAADVNNSEDVSAADIVALRQVILGMEDDFTRYNGQTSWRFADQGENLADNPDPWPFTEVLGEAEITAQGGESDFHGIKIGDVNGDAQSNGLTGSSTRGNATVTLVAEDVNLEVGETYTMEVTSDNFAEVSGYQFTMSYDASTLRYTGVESGVLRVNGSNVGTANVANGMITMSWNELSGEAVSVGTDKVLFTVTFEVLTEAKASESVNINSVITAAEAYDADVQVKGLNLEFRDGGEVVEVFDLYQNVPNPFKGSTVIGFTLPSEMTAILTVYDVSGKVLLVRDVDGKRGYNEEMIRNTELNGAGVLYYQLDAEDYTATKRMVLID